MLRSYAERGAVNHSDFHGLKCAYLCTGSGLIFMSTINLLPDKWGMQNYALTVCFSFQIFGYLFTCVREEMKAIGSCILWLWLATPLFPLSLSMAVTDKTGMSSNPPLQVRLRKCVKVILMLLNK